MISLKKTKKVNLCTQIRKPEQDLYKINTTYSKSLSRAPIYLVVDHAKYLWPSIQKKRINKSDLSFLQKLKKDIFSKVPLPLSGYVETHSDRGRGTGPLPLSGCVSTYPDRGRGLTLHA